MATKKQIEANRKNAQKSTGPQTPDGKSIVAQNALKHGLTAQKPLIPGEDPDHFAQFSDSMLAQFDPQGPLETVMANRIITLTWQLNRAPRIQAAAFKFMMKDIYHPPYDSEEHLGKTIVWDIANNQTLEKLQAYESRIESNLYKTIDKLEIIQKQRTQSVPPLYLTPTEVGDHSQNTQPAHQPTQPPCQHEICKNKPNSQIETPTKMSSPAKKCKAKRALSPEQHRRDSIPQSTNHELKTTNSIPQNKPNLNKSLTRKKNANKELSQK